MWACRPTRFGEGAAGIGSLFGRPYRPPLRRGSGLVRRAGCPHPAKLGQHRTIWQEHSAKDFASYESYKRAGILYVFPPFITARMGQKIGRRPQTQLCGDALGPGITELAIIATLSGRIYNPPLQTHAVPVSAVGAHYICARDHRGLRAARPGHGGMWACRPTAFGGARQEPRVRPCAGCEPPVNFLFRPFTRWVKWSKID